MKIWIVLIPDGDYNPIAFDSVFDNEKAANNRAEKLRKQYGDEYINVIDYELRTSYTSPDFTIFNCEAIARNICSACNPVKKYVPGFNDNISQSAELMDIELYGYKCKPRDSFSTVQFRIGVLDKYVTDDFKTSLEDFTSDLGSEISDLADNGTEYEELQTYTITKINKFLDNTIREKNK